METSTLLAAFPALRPRLLGILTPMVGPTDAEDLVNETLFKALAALPDFQERAALATWLHRIAVNLARDHLRRLGRQPVVAVDMDDLPDTVDDGPDGLEQHQMSQCVQRVLTTLPPAQYQLLLKADVQELSTSEIAREAGITPGNAKIRLHRARRALQSALQTQCDFHHREEGVLCCTPKATV